MSEPLFNLHVLNKVTKLQGYKKELCYLNCYSESFQENPSDKFFLVVFQIEIVGLNRRCPMKKACFRNFAKFTESCRPTACSFVKRRLRCFPVNISNSFSVSTCNIVPCDFCRNREALLFHIHTFYKLIFIIIYFINGNIF